MENWVLTCLFCVFCFGVCYFLYMQYNEEFQLKCIISTVDGNRYCVREQNRLNEAADLLAKTTDKCKNLIDYLNETDPQDDRVKRLVKNFNPQKIMETLPTSEHTAYSENKGEKIAFCLHVENDEVSPLIDENTLMFVAIHELSHVASIGIGHKKEFWDNFKWLLENAKSAGIHDPINYKQQPQKYCGMQIRDNPYFDM